MGLLLFQDLKKWLDESKDGLVYINFGSQLRMETYPKQILVVIFGELKKIEPIRVLVKIYKPKDLTIELPKNVKTWPWISQEKVLRT